MVLQPFKAWIYLVLTWLYLHYAMTVRQANPLADPFLPPLKKLHKKLELIHLDLAGPMQNKSLQSSYYTATFIDDYSSHAVIYFLKTKDQFLDAFKKFINWATTQSPNKFHILQSDRGGKYTGAKV